MFSPSSPTRKSLVTTLLVNVVTCRHYCTPRIYATVHTWLSRGNHSTQRGQWEKMRSSRPSCARRAKCSPRRPSCDILSREVAATSRREPRSAASPLRKQKTDSWPRLCSMADRSAALRGPCPLDRWKPPRASGSRMVRSTLDGFAVEELQQRFPGIEASLDVVRAGHDDERTARLLAARGMRFRSGWAPARPDPAGGNSGCKTSTTPTFARRSQIRSRKCRRPMTVACVATLASIDPAAQQIGPVSRHSTAGTGDCLLLGMACRRRKFGTVVVRRCVSSSQNRPRPVRTIG